MNFKTIWNDAAFVLIGIVIAYSITMSLISHKYIFQAGYLRTHLAQADKAQIESMFSVVSEHVEVGQCDE